MATECEITMAVEQAQIRMFDLAKRKHGITRKVLNLETGIAISTLRSYEEGTSMPVSALVKMARVIPNELLRLMLAVGGKELGGASCMERVWQYVLVWGVAVTLKKKSPCN